MALVKAVGKTAKTLATLNQAIARPEVKRQVQQVVKVARTVAPYVKSAASYGFAALQKYFSAGPRKAAVSSQGGPVSTVSAAATSGQKVVGMQYAFHNAPDIGLGPGLRLIASMRLPACVTGAVDTTNATGWTELVDGKYHPMLALDPSLPYIQGDSLSAQKIPCIFQQATGLQTLSKMFERFLFRHVSIDMVTNQGTSNAGAVAVGYYRDATRLDGQVSGTKQTNYDLALSVPSGCGSPLWEPFSITALHIPDSSPISPADCFYVHSEDKATEAGTTAGRLECQGAILYGQSAGTTVSTTWHLPWAHVVLDLYCPAVITDNVDLAHPSIKYIGSKGRNLRDFVRRAVEDALAAEHSEEKSDLKSESSVGQAPVMIITQEPNTPTIGRPKSAPAARQAVDPPMSLGGAPVLRRGV